MRIFEREGYDLDGLDPRGCFIFDMGGKQSGTTVSTGTVETSAQFIPSVNVSNPPALVSPYPAGQGLATLNTAYPASAAYQPSTYATGTSSSSSTSLTMWLVLAAIVGGGAWFLLRRRR